MKPSSKNPPFQAIRAARAVAEMCRRQDITFPTASRRRLSDTLDRLERGDIFDDRHAPALKRLEQELVEALDTARPGYGVYALNQDTRYDDILDPHLDALRRAIETWKRFWEKRSLGYHEGTSPSPRQARNSGQSPGRSDHSRPLPEAAGRRPIRVCPQAMP